MRIYTTAELFNRESGFLFATLMPIEKVEAKMDFNTKEIVTFGGKPVYRLPVGVISHGENGTREVKGVSVAVLNPNIKMAVGRAYQAKKGTKVAVTPYIRDGRVAYSLIIEDIEECTQQ